MFNIKKIVIIDIIVHWLGVLFTSLMRFKTFIYPVVFVEDFIVKVIFLDDPLKLCNMTPDIYSGTEQNII